MKRKSLIDLLAEIPRFVNLFLNLVNESFICQTYSCIIFLTSDMMDYEVR